jgi:hypothetical protein
MKEREKNLDAVIEILGHSDPILAQLETSCTSAFRSSLASAIGLNTPFEGPIQFWNRSTR